MPTEDEKMQAASAIYGLKPDTIRDLLDHGFELDRRFGSTEVRITRRVGVSPRPLDGPLTPVL